MHLIVCWCGHTVTQRTFTVSGWCLSTRAARFRIIGGSRPHKEPWGDCCLVVAVHSYSELWAHTSSFTWNKVKLDLYLTCHDRDHEKYQSNKKKSWPNVIPERWVLFVFKREWVHRSVAQRERAPRSVVTVAKASCADHMTSHRAVEVQ